jgi:energy-coupling factor transporter ATP-binding protein EcfA2
VVLCRVHPGPRPRQGHLPGHRNPTGETLIARDIQALELFRDREGGLERLAGQLTRIALDAQGGFLWDATRSPLPGLAAFTEDDAAVYFGRDDEIRRLIERLNARRAQGGAQFIALLGSSGSGKSSLLRAKVAGIHVDNTLVQQIVQDAQTDDALPLIAFALRELYDNAPGDEGLTLHDYMQMGDAAAGCTPLENAVSKAADQALSSIQATTDEELALKTAFVNNLVRINDKGEYARSPAKMDDLPSGSKRLFDALVAARLMVVQDEPPTIEVTHEALLRKWPRLHA